MAFVAENGTGLPNANALITAAFYRDYHTTRGRTVAAEPILLDATIQGWIVRATDYLSKRFGLKFQGTRLTLTQSLPFPREAVTIDGVDVIMCQLYAATPVNQGAGYTVGDIVTISNGTFTTAATCQVDAVTSGAVTALSVLDAGDYSVIPTGANSPAGGTGTGLTATLQFGGPIPLSQAVAEYARIASTVAELAPTPPLPFDTEDADGGIISGGGAIISRDEKVGPIEESTTYAGPKDLPVGPKGSATVSGWALPTYPAADLLIEPYLTNTTGVIRN